ncbi:HXXEE domain-containing protein [Paenibacillus glucanolyticus]|uniref:HXXEE domain-containing protein n=1 Tax=Paenibacillus glucanolyticus TaxID=59843 RepID=UPI0034CD09D2
MKFHSRNWYYIGGILFVIMSFVMGFFGDGVSQIEKILIFSFMSLLVHQFEEYGLPGGFPAFFNVIMNGEKEAPDRYPQNSQLAMVVNVVLAYPFYMAAIIFPDAIWLGLATMYFGFSQILMHGIVMNRKLKSFYNPGLAASIFLHGPIGVYYTWYVTTHDLAGTWDYIAGIIAMIAAAVIIVALPIKLFSSRQAKYPFSQEEMERFGMSEKAKRLSEPMRVQKK